MHCTTTHSLQSDPVESAWAVLVQLGVIPARYGSTRFPGKPMVMIAGKPMIQVAPHGRSNPNPGVQHVEYPRHPKRRSPQHCTLPCRHHLPGPVSHAHSVSCTASGLERGGVRTGSQRTYEQAKKAKKLDRIGTAASPLSLPLTRSPHAAPSHPGCASAVVSAVGGTAEVDAHMRPVHLGRVRALLPLLLSPPRALCRRALQFRRLPKPQGWARRVLMGGTVLITIVFTCGELRAPLRRRWLRSPPHTPPRTPWGAAASREGQRSSAHMRPVLQRPIRALLPQPPLRGTRHGSTADSRGVLSPLSLALARPSSLTSLSHTRGALTVVATDDERIKAAVEACGGEVVMTASEIPNGTERCNAAQLALTEQYDIVVNIQVRRLQGLALLSTTVDPTEGYTHAANVWAWCTCCLPILSPRVKPYSSDSQQTTHCLSGGGAGR